MQTSAGVANAESWRKPRQTTQRMFDTYFHTGCSVCGRPLRLLVKRLGQVVAGVLRVIDELEIENGVAGLRRAK